MNLLLFLVACGANAVVAALVSFPCGSAALNAEVLQVFHKKKYLSKWNFRAPLVL